MRNCLSSVNILPSAIQKELLVLAPDCQDPVGADISDCGRRASQRLSFDVAGSLFGTVGLDRSTAEWRLTGLDFGSREIHLQRLGIDSWSWCNLVRRFGSPFKRAAGGPGSLAVEATRRGQRYLHAPGSHLLAT